jgi:hypothetical protein
MLPDCGPLAGLCSETTFYFRKIIADGWRTGLWGGSRARRNPAYAFDALYAGLGITPEIWTVATVHLEIVKPEVPSCRDSPINLHGFAVIPACS